MLEGNEAWKEDDDDPEYNAQEIRQALDELLEARSKHDREHQLYIIKTGLRRDLGRMHRRELWCHSYIGTKRLIERYTSTVIETIEQIVADALDRDNETAMVLMQDLTEARANYGRTALCLSGGATLGMTHIGVCKAMYESGLLPYIISGASAGSIIAAVLCSKREEEYESLIQEFPYRDLDVFSPKDATWADYFRTMISQRAVCDIQGLIRVMRSWLGDTTFIEAYHRTRRILNICVTPKEKHDLPTLLNYLTSPHVLIWSAVAASCNLPPVFKSIPLMMKDPSTGEFLPWQPPPRDYIDGSFHHDVPMARLAELFGVSQLVVSQVNPHIVPFLDQNDMLEPSDSPRQRKPGERGFNVSKLATKVKEMAVDEICHRIRTVREVTPLPYGVDNFLDKFHRIMSQNYHGDVTIWPRPSFSDTMRLIANPDPSFMLRQCEVGERAAWPKMSQLRVKLGIEMALDRAVMVLRDKVFFTQNAADLRRKEAGVPDLVSPEPRFVKVVRRPKVKSEVDEEDEESPEEWVLGPKRHSWSCLRFAVQSDFSPFATPEVSPEGTDEEKPNEEEEDGLWIDFSRQRKRQKERSMMMMMMMKMGKRKAYSAHTSPVRRSKSIAQLWSPEVIERLAKTKLRPFEPGELTMPPLRGEVGVRVGGVNTVNGLSTSEEEGVWKRKRRVSFADERGGTLEMGPTPVGTEAQHGNRRASVERRRASVGQVSIPIVTPKRRTASVEEPGESSEMAAARARASGRRSFVPDEDEACLDGVVERQGCLGPIVEASFESSMSSTPGQRSTSGEPSNSPPLLVQASESSPSPTSSGIDKITSTSGTTSGTTSGSTSTDSSARIMSLNRDIKLPLSPPPPRPRSPPLELMWGEDGSSDVDLESFVGDPDPYHEDEGMSGNSVGPWFDGEEGEDGGDWHGVAAEPAGTGKRGVVKQKEERGVRARLPVWSAPDWVGEASEDGKADEMSEVSPLTTDVPGRDKQRVPSLVVTPASLPTSPPQEGFAKQNSDSYKLEEKPQPGEVVEREREASTVGEEVFEDAEEWLAPGPDPEPKADEPKHETEVGGSEKNATTGKKREREKRKPAQDEWDDLFGPGL